MRSKRLVHGDNYWTSARRVLAPTEFCGASAKFPGFRSGASSTNLDTPLAKSKQSAGVEFGAKCKIKCSPCDTKEALMTRKKKIWKSVKQGP